MKRSELHNADSLQLLGGFQGGEFDACVTDGPYELGFMGHAWDKSGIVNRSDFWREVLRVMKPGAFLLSFGGTRTSHRMVCAIEDAGFEIRDSILWLYGQGFPKSKRLGKGRGTALKPAHEPICVARKPIAEKSTFRNDVVHGTGGLNVDGCRIPAGDPQYRQNCAGDRGHADSRARVSEFEMTAGRANTLGRWPANVILDETTAEQLDNQTGCLRSGHLKAGTQRDGIGYRGALGCEVRNEFAASVGGASRFFYCAKTARREREAGLAAWRDSPLRWSAGTKNPGSFQSPKTKRTAKNDHPTVKPIALMRYLVRLVTPEGGTVLDPFLGSGTTGIACALENFGFVGIDKTERYVRMSRARIDHWRNAA